MRVWVACLWACVVASVAYAQPAEIRSGNHETFARLVIPIVEGAEWDVAPEDDGYTLTLDGAPDGYDLSRIFDRIPRDRIADVSQPQPGTLSIQVECECFADAFLWQPDRLVVDIVDGPPPEEFEPLIETASSDVPRDMAEVRDRPERVLPLLFGRSPPSSPFENSASALVEAAPTSDLQPPEPDVSATESALMEGIARAASQGYLEANVAATIAEPVTDPVEPMADVAQSTVLAADVGPRADTVPGIGISTAIDRDLALLEDALGELVTPQCLSDDFYALSAWADDRPFNTQVAEHLLALVGDFGEAPLEAYDALARFYIHFGFGAEARQILDADEAESQSRAVLRELAGLVDGDLGPYPVTRAQRGCPTLGGFWSFLAEATAPDGDARDSILQQFFGLPQPLRGHLAPRVSAQFLEIGDADTAQIVLRATRAQDVETAHDVQTTRAQVALAQGDQANALALLQDEIDQNARTTPASLIRLIDLKIELGETPTEADLLLAASLRQEYRNDPVAAELELAEAKGRAARGDFVTALALTVGREDRLALAQTDRTLSQMAAFADATTFLNVAFDDLPLGVTAATENRIAARLTELGFPDRALAILKTPAQREAAAERRFVRAEAALELGDYALVIEALQGINDDAARELRSAALNGLGDHDGALIALGGAPGEPRQQNLEFRAEAWDRLTLQDDPALAAFAGTMVAQSDAADLPTLAAQRDLLQRSENSRDAIEQLLGRFEVPSATE